ncbi:MAG: hypothetical protein JSS76_13190 [Bacteroidetes bacterium]|nr:hypothetical protein [Bacteroidota bacterium]
MNPEAKNSNTLEWVCIKLSYVLVSAPVTCIMALNAQGCPFPEGVCRVYDFGPFFSAPGSYITIGAFLILCLLYIAEKWMVPTTFFLSAISCIIISRHESNGIFYRATVLSVIWIFQFLAYLFYRLRPAFRIDIYRMQYGTQAVAAVYTLAGIAKLTASGLEWVNAGGGFPAQIMKNYSYLYFDSGDMTYMHSGYMLALFLLHHPGIIQFFLTISLVLEVFCLAAVFNKRILLIWGVGLLMMHIGIAALMGIGISIIAKPMVVFFINPLYLVIKGIRYLRSKWGLSQNR